MVATFTAAEEDDMGMNVEYTRVSTLGQKLDVQLDRLADSDRVYREKMSASSARRKPCKLWRDFVA